MKNLLPLLIIILYSVTLSGQGLNSLNKNLPCLEKDFPVMVHLTVDSSSRQQFLQPNEVVELMDKVSAFFDPICLSFSSCEINVIDNYTFHNIVDPLRLQELRILYGKPRRLNVFILGSIPDASCGSSTTYGINQDGGEYIYLETEDCDEALEGQLAHHLGHYFGLQDTYHGSTVEIVDDPSCAIVGDSICDTPTDPFGRYTAIGEYEDLLAELIELEEFVVNCEFIHDKLDPNGVYYQPQIGNIMSAYPCKCGFTNGQLEKMSRNYSLSSHKPY